MSNPATVETGQRVRALAPGVIACAVIAAAAKFLSELRRAGDAVRAAARHRDELPVGRWPVRARSVAFSARTVLRWGVALLGLRITGGEIAALGWQPVVGVVASVALTMGISIVAARLMGFRTAFGVLSGVPPRSAARRPRWRWRRRCRRIRSATRR